MTKRRLFIAAFVFLVIAAYYIYKRVEKRMVPQLNLSTIVLKDLNSQPINLAAFSGKPLVINFWGTWCGPCREELPGFKVVKEKYNGQINIVLVSDESLEKLTAFRDANNYDFLYVQSQKTLDEIGISSVPVTFFYNQNGAFIAAKKGNMSEMELDEMIAGMVK